MMLKPAFAISSLTYRTANMPVSEYKQTLKLTSSAVADMGSAAIPDGFVVQSSKELGDLIHRAEDKNSKPDRDQSIQFAHDALAAGNRLDAMLALMEVGLSSGDKLVEEVKKLNDGADKDPQFQLFIKAVSLSTDPHSSQEAEKLFDQIDRTKLKKAYELDIYKANCVLADGKPAEAGQLFLKALKANPYISGAWADLGDTYYSSFRMDLAWQCWDEARRLSPGNPIAAKVNELEDHLRTTYPDFF
jgi:tetratricopeptide (TPR) repeat protein